LLSTLISATIIYALSPIENINKLLSKVVYNSLYNHRKARI
jgi:hypothetical protein